MNKLYAGVGARVTPTVILEQMTKLSMDLCTSGWTLRSGGQAQGADQAFEDGCLAIDGSKEIYLSEDGFCGKHHEPTSGYYSSVDERVIEESLRFHPNPGALTEHGRRLMGRNLQIILGGNLNMPVSMLICWTRGGKVVGGTGHAMRVAKHYGIPIFNLADKNALGDIDAFIHFMS